MSTKIATDQSVRNVADQAMLAEGTGNKVGTSDVILGDGASINTTDFGAIKEALGFARDNGAQAFTFGAAALDQVGALAKSQATAMAENLRVTSSLAENIKTDGAAQTQKIMLIVAGVTAVLAVFGIGAFVWSQSNE